MIEKVAILGMGNMGGAIAACILRSGLPVIVWNRTKIKAQPLLDAGADWADSPAEASSVADAVITMLADDEAAETVWFGNEAAMPAMRPGSFVIECSTLSREQVRRQAAAAKELGLKYIDCPVTGIPAVAAEGGLSLLVGADPDHLEACRSLLKSFSTTIRHFGPVGTGTSYKLMINLMGAVQIAALAEGIALAEKLGLDRETMVAAIETSAAASPQVLRYIRPMAEKKFSPTPSFTVDLRYKDALYATVLAGSTGAAVKLGIVARDLFDEARNQFPAADEAKLILTLSDR